MTSVVGSNKAFSVYMIDLIPSLDTLEKGQCFPLYWYEKNNENTLFNNKQIIKYDAISDFIKKIATNQYKKNIEKEEIFIMFMVYYIPKIMAEHLLQT